MTDVTKLERHEIWRRYYRSRPYLKATSEKELQQRLRDLMKNILILTEDGKIGVGKPSPETSVWWEKLTHVFEELSSRGAWPNELLTHEILPRATAPEIPRAVRALQGVHVPVEAEAMVKFGQREHMAEMVETGEIRIGPAAGYNDPSLNPAMRDDELTIATVLPGEETRITLKNKDPKGPEKEIKAVGDVTISHECTTNYFVYCLSYALDLRMFDDFSADACVIIRQPEAFRDRLLKAVAEKLPSWIDWDQSVVYVDPFLPPDEPIQVTSSKHFRYSYQREYRFVWLPPTRTNELEPFFVTLGSLEGIAEMVELPR